VPRESHRFGCSVSSACWRSESKPRGHQTEGSSTVLTEEQFRLGLGFLPGRPDLDEELLPLGCEPDRLVPAASRRVRLHPAILLHEFHIPAQCGLLDPQEPRDLGRAGLGQARDGREDVRLAGPRPYGRRVSSYSAVIARLISRTRTAMHSCAIRSARSSTIRRGSSPRQAR
jgi:hypothetical protein